MKSGLPSRSVAACFGGTVQVLQEHMQLGLMISINVANRQHETAKQPTRNSRSDGTPEHYCTTGVDNAST